MVVSSRKPRNVAQAINQLERDGYSDVIGVKCHVSEANDRKNLFDETIKAFGKIYILVPNANKNSTVECPEDAWDRIFDVNIKSSFLLPSAINNY